MPIDLKPDPLSSQMRRQAEHNGRAELIDHAEQLYEPNTRLVIALSRTSKTISGEEKTTTRTDKERIWKVSEMRSSGFQNWYDRASANGFRLEHIGVFGRAHLDQFSRDIQHQFPSRVSGRSR